MSKTYDYRIKMLEAQRPWFIGAIALSFIILLLVLILFLRSRGIGIYLERQVEQRTSELEFQTSLIQNMLDSIPDHVFCKDLDSKFTLTNKHMADFFGIDKDAAIGKGEIDGLGITPELAKKMTATELPVVNEGKTVINEELVPTADGSGERLFETVKTPLTYNGQVIGLIAIAHDITDRKKIESELALRTSTLQAIVDSIPGIVFCKDLNLVYTLCNKYAEEYMRTDKSRIIGKHNEEGLKLAPEALGYVRALEQKVINENKKIVYETIIPANDGSSNRLFEITVAPLTMENAVAGIIGIAHDVTDRKAMEEEAWAASRSKSAFLATMSHEIRTPMNSIMGFAELAQDTYDMTRVKEFLGKITDSTKWLLRIINDILDISKIESGKMELERVPFDLHEIFSRCQSVILPKVKEKTLDLRIYVEPPPPGKKFLGDPVRVYQALINLLSNAVKFTSAGFIKFSSAIKKWENGRAAVYFEVKDSGIGMTEEQIQKIFEPFIQADSSTTRNYGGTGLGLAITKNIVELMGGKLCVESDPGVGSAFSFEITFDTIESDGKPDDGEEYIELEKPHFDGQILICDDNTMNRQVICEHLSRVGIESIVAENGKDGVEAVQIRAEMGEKPFDLIFMDMFMPVMDGMEASAKIMALGTGAPIVAMTANIMASEIEKYKKHGMPDCLGKPFTSQELWRLLLKYLTPVSVTQMDKTERAKQDKAESDLLRKLRLKFAKNNKNLIDEIDGAIAAGDTKLAHRLAHTLKGSAGQLGKTMLQSFAAEVETMLKNSAAVPEDKMNRLKTELSSVLEELKPLLDNEAERHEGIKTVSLDTKETSALFEKVGVMLEGINPSVVNFIDDLRTVPGTEELVRQIENYDFTAARETLKRIMPE